MNRPTTKIKLESGTEVEIRQWITGREQEYTEEPLFKATSLGGKGKDDVNLEIRADQAIHENNHREIEVFIEKITIGEKTLSQESDGKEVILKTILDELPSSDYEKILNEIKEIREKSKKK